MKGSCEKKPTHTTLMLSQTVTFVLEPGYNNFSYDTGHIYENIVNLYLNFAKGTMAMLRLPLFYLKPVFV